MTGKCVSLPDDPAKNGPNKSHTLSDAGITIHAVHRVDLYVDLVLAVLVERAQRLVHRQERGSGEPGARQTFMCAMPTSADCTAAKAAHVRDDVQHLPQRYVI